MSELSRESAVAGPPTPVEVSPARPNEAGYPKVQGRCPACRMESLFLGSGGYVTCAVLRCPDPTRVSQDLGAL